VKNVKSSDRTIHTTKISESARSFDWTTGSVWCSDKGQHVEEVTTQEVLQNRRNTGKSGLNKKNKRRIIKGQNHEVPRLIKDR
jgi:hypothetical protein